MIGLELSEALAVYLFMVVGVLLWAWFWPYGKRRRSFDRFNATQFVQRCPYCGHVLLDYRNLELIVCPVCKSYFEGHQNGITHK